MRLDESFSFLLKILNDIWGIVQNYESEGRGFESLPAHQEKQRLNVKFVAAFLFLFINHFSLGAYLALISLWALLGA